MPANPTRRAKLTDAALQVLGSEGSRGLTHRAVDKTAGVPAGSTANYFPSRSSLFLAMAERIFARLEPEETRLEELAKVPLPGAATDYAAYVIERLLDNPILATALIELRLEAARNEDIREVLTPFLRGGFEADLRFHLERGLPGGHDEVLRLHHLINGIVLDAITIPLDPKRSPIDEVREGVSRLLSDTTD